jgi:hypothetical protein
MQLDLCALTVLSLLLHMCQQSRKELRNNAERKYVIILASDEVYIHTGCQMFMVMSQSFSGRCSYEKLRAIMSGLFSSLTNLITKLLYKHSCSGEASQEIPRTL